MNDTTYRPRTAILAAGLLLAMMASAGRAMHTGTLVPGIPGPSFTLTAQGGYISTADGNSIYFWGYANSPGAAQYVGPTLIVNQGATVTVTLYNALPVPTSIVFPGQAVTAFGGSAGLLTQEATAGAPVTYTFTAAQPGTYLYHSGTQPDLQIEMGLVGALIVRPTGFDAMNPVTWRAYAHDDSAFGSEFLFLCTEMDEAIHDQVEAQVRRNLPIAVDTTKRYPVYWFINGRTGPDTMWPDNVSYIPAQPYSCMPMCHPGEVVLMRMVGGGRDYHPFHHHGNHSRIIARDGRLLSSGAAGAGADLSHQVFTIPVTPGGTTDALWSWTGKGLGWDVYGHSAALVAMDDMDNAPTGWAAGGTKGPEDVDTNGNGIFETSLMPYEDPDSHGKPFPVTLPADQDLTFGLMYGGSPFLGTPGVLPPGQGGFNPSGGFMYMWHSHAEKEICNNNIFPGGMLTMGMVEAWPMAPMPMMMK